MKHQYSLFITDCKDHQDEGQWRSYDLESHGNSLEELLDNAVYWQTDQDGGSLGEVKADDSNAEKIITAWFENKLIDLGANK